MNNPPRPKTHGLTSDVPEHLLEVFQQTRHGILGERAPRPDAGAARGGNRAGDRDRGLRSRFATAARRTVPRHVLRLDHRPTVKVHGYFPRGEQRWQQIITRWNLNKCPAPELAPVHGERYQARYVCEPIQSGSCWVQVSSANVSPDTPSAATNSSASRISPVSGLMMPSFLPRVVDEQLLARHVRLPHRDRKPLRPFLVSLAEPAVAAAVRMLRLVFLPQQIERDAFPADLAMHSRPVRHAARWLAPRRRRIQPRLERRVVRQQFRWQRPAQPCQPRAAQVMPHRRCRGTDRVGDLPLVDESGSTGL